MFEKKYPALMLISKIYKGLAYIAFFIGIIALLLVISNLKYFEDIIIPLLYTVLSSPFIGTLFFAISEIIMLFINIEENTRK